MARQEAADLADLALAPAGVHNDDARLVDRLCSAACAGALRCRSTVDRGRVLVAGRSFEQGALVLQAQPLVQARASPTSLVYQRIEALCAERPEVLELDAIWYWSIVLSLTETQRGALEEVSGLPAALTEEQQRKLLLLQGGRPEDQLADRDLVAAAVLAERLFCAAELQPLLARLLRVWAVNCFETSEPPEPASLALYFVPSFLSHSCNPAAIWYVADKGSGYELRTRRKLAEGEEVSISYLSEVALVDTARSRQQLLLASKDFICTCERCREDQPDLSRGFHCRGVHCGGFLFATCASEHRVQPPRFRLRRKRAGSGAPSGAFGTCGRCGAAPSASQAAALLAEERWLEGLVEDWNENPLSQRIDFGFADAERLDRRVARTFQQHVLASQAQGHLAAFYFGRGKLREAQRLTRCRLAFHVAAFPGNNAVYAWTLEGLADMLSAPLSVNMLDRCEEPDAACRAKVEALELYEQARQCFASLFGAEHRYTVSPAQKAASIRLALTQLVSC